MPATINGTMAVEAEVSDNEVAWAVHQVMLDRHFGGDYDDAGCDWLTDASNTNTYVSGGDWHVSNDPDVAAMVNAINILLYNRMLKVEETE